MTEDEEMVRSWLLLTCGGAELTAVFTDRAAWSGARDAMWAAVAALEAELVSQGPDHVAVRSPSGAGMVRATYTDLLEAP